VFVEPIALYMTRDLHEEGDGLWTSVYEALGDGAPIRLGDVGVHGDGTDLAIVTYGNGYYLSRQAERLLAAEGVNARVIDLRWLGPVDEDKLVAAVGDATRVLIVDECRITGSQSEALMATFVERTPDKKLARLALRAGGARRDADAAEPRRHCCSGEGVARQGLITNRLP
jgi:2-oxoisovalerate dehydrogenase E1 component